MGKHAILLIFVAVFSIYAVAQQNDTNTSSPAPAGQSASDRQPIPAPTSSNFWDGDDPNFVNLITHPFANKKYVLRHTQPIRDRLNELDQLTSENGRTIKDVDSRAQQGVQMASEKVNLADQHATDSTNRAQLAQTAATEASTRVGNAERMIDNLDRYKGTAETEIQFRSGQSVLSKSAKDALDQMAGPLKDQRNYIIEVRGFSSGRGATATAASRKMADSVVRYLVLTHQIPVYRIYVMSLGNAALSGQKRVSGGRVEVSVLKNDLVNTAQR
jgi:outer membrane protein OmpA-like peptidoglycan-associated protein